jgi:histidine ammonia-lyase
MPATVYSIPTSANAEDHVSMGANEARHVLAMADDLGKVLALELMTAAQALDLRLAMVEGEAHPGHAVAAAHGAIRARIAFLEHDRALDGDVRAALALVDDGTILAAARTVVP